MNNKIIELLKDKNYIISNKIIRFFSSNKVSFNSFLIVIYLINEKEPITLNYNHLSEEFNIPLKEIMISIEELKNKQYISVKLEKNNDDKMEEKIYLDFLYNKLLMNIIDKEEEVETNDIFSRFEEEFGRTLSPIEYELINGWLEFGYEKEIVLEALREAKLNDVTNLKYIDRILIEWNKKGIKNISQVKKDRENFSKKKNIEIPEFDWVNDEENI